MNSARSALRIAALIFGLVCGGQIWRLLAHAEVRISTHSLPMWPSAVVAVISGALAIWMWNLSTNGSRS